MTVPPGWYPDPELPGGLRWFDGDAWTADRSTARAVVEGGRERATAPDGAAVAVEVPRRVTPSAQPVQPVQQVQPVGTARPVQPGVAEPAFAIPVLAPDEDPSRGLATATLGVPGVPHSQLRAEQRASSVQSWEPEDQAPMRTWSAASQWAAAAAPQLPPTASARTAAVPVPAPGLVPASVGSQSFQPQGDVPSGIGQAWLGPAVPPTGLRTPAPAPAPEPPVQRFPDPRRRSRVAVLVVSGLVVAGAVAAVGLVGIPMLEDQQETAALAALGALTCGDVASEAALTSTLAAAGAEQPGVPLSATSELRVADDARADLALPRGDDQAFVMSCAGVGRWADGTVTPVMIELSVDASGGHVVDVNWEG